MTNTSRNLTVRINLLRTDINRLQMLQANDIEIPIELIQTIKEQLKVCKELIRKEKLNTPITNLLRLVTNYDYELVETFNRL